MDQLPPELSQFLTFIASPVFGAWVVSEVLEQQQWFLALPPGRKAIQVLAVMLLLGVLSFALVRWVPPSATEQLQPLYAIVVATIAAFVSGKVYHVKTHHPTETTSEQREQAAREAKWVEAPKLSGAPEPAA